MPAVLEAPRVCAPPRENPWPTNGRPILECAKTLYETRPDWVTFFREVLGVDGLVRTMFKRPEELAAYEATESYAEIQRMLAELRAVPPKSEAKEPTRVITIRLPRSLHESLLAEAHDHHTSMNQLAIGKLLKRLEAEA